MKVLRVPFQLRLATLCLFLNVGWATLQLLLVAQAPWWGFPLPTILSISAAVTVVCGFFAWQLLQGRKIWLRILGISVSFVCGVSLLTALIQKDFGLGIFSLCLSFYWLLQYFWLDREMGRSYLDPQMKWYQGFPKPIAALKCSLAWQGPALGKGIEGEFGVCRLDRDGVFLYAPRNQAGMKSLAGLRKGKVELEFVFRQKKTLGQGVVVCSDQNGSTVGIQFAHMVSDQRKKMGDFIEVLKGEGYV